MPGGEFRCRASTTRKRVYREGRGGISTWLLWKGSCHFTVPAAEAQPRRRRVLFNAYRPLVLRRGIVRLQRVLGVGRLRRRALGWALGRPPAAWLQTGGGSCLCLSLCLVSCFGHASCFSKARLHLLLYWFGLCYFTAAGAFWLVCGMSVWPAYRRPLLSTVDSVPLHRPPWEGTHRGPGFFVCATCLSFFVRASLARFATCWSLR